MLALLDDQRHRSRDDEDRDEHAEAAERRGDGDQLRAPDLDGRRLGVSTRTAREDRSVAGGRADAPEVEARSAEDPDRIDSAGMTCEARGLRVGEEDQRSPVRRRTRVRDPDDRDGASALRRRQTLARTEVGRERGDDLVHACRRTAGDEAVRGELRAAPAVRLHVVRTEAGGNRIVGDRRAYARHRSKTTHELRC